jgi:hypothetical protein
VSGGDVSQEYSSAALWVDWHLSPESRAIASRKAERAQRSVGYSEPRNSIAMNRKTSEATVDRLIELANEETSVDHPEANSQGHTNLEAVPVFGGGETPRELEHNPMWQSLLQFRVLLPYVSRLLEMSHNEPSPAISAELKQSMGELVNSQRELKLAMEDQVVHMKHLEEEMARAKELNERNVTENLEIVEDVRAVQSTVKKAATSVGILLAVLIGLMIWLLVRGFHLH